MCAQADDLCAVQAVHALRGVHILCPLQRTVRGVRLAGSVFLGEAEGVEEGAGPAVHVVGEDLAA
jgi:hypothetical protein